MHDAQMRAAVKRGDLEESRLRQRGEEEVLHNLGQRDLLLEGVRRNITLQSLPDEILDACTHFSFLPRASFRIPPKPRTYCRTLWFLNAEAMFSTASASVDAARSSRSMRSDSVTKRAPSGPHDTPGRL